METVAQDLKRKHVADEHSLSESEEVKRTKHEADPQKLLETSSRVIEGLFWTLPVELKDLVSAHLSEHDLKQRLQVASGLIQTHGPPINKQGAAEYFLKTLYKTVFFSLHPQDVHTFDGLVEGSTTANFSAIRNVLFETFIPTNEIFVRLLQGFRKGSDSNVRIVSFTAGSLVDNATLLVLEKFFQRHMTSLEAIVIPSYDDGPIHNAWAFHYPRTKAEVKEIDRQNLIVASSNPPIGLPGHQSCILEQTGDFELRVTKRRPDLPDSSENKLSKSISTKLDVLVHSWAPANLCRKMVAEDNRYRVRDLSITSLRQDPRIRMSIGPIIEGLGWSHPVSLEELRLNFVNCAEYGRAMISSEMNERPRIINMESIKLLQLHECDGNIELIKGICEGSVNVETFLFSVNDGAIHDAEEDALVQFVQSAKNLRTLSLAYIPPPIPAKTQSSDSPELAADEDSPVMSPGSRLDGTQEQAHDDVDQAVFTQEYCRFPLARLLGPVNRQLRSLALTQDLGCKIRTEDLVYIGNACPYLTDLAIAFPDIADTFLGAYLDAYVKLQLKALADVLKAYQNLKYLQLIASGAHRDLSPGYVSPLERITRLVIKSLAEHGLQIEYFTIALRNDEHPHAYGAEACHLRVHPDADLSETVGEKTLKRDMAMYGDCLRCNFEDVVQKKTGFAYDC
ncbi:hypothetical protein J4E80_000507 [Alternaria sp. BMP 0032]|nr:hypothetical protein J4E80_000507 [Alternaria sp. BMP 0032]